MNADENNPLLFSLGSRSYSTNAIAESHALIVDKTKRLSKYFIFSVWTGETQAAILLAIWILFAMTFYDYSPQVMFGILIGQQICRVIAILAVSYFCDKYGFDKCILVTSTIVVVGMVLACVSYNMIILAFAIVIEALSGYEAEVIAAAFIAKILPFNSASVYYGYLATAKGCGYLGGIIIAGLVSTVFGSTTADGYRIALYFALGFCVLRWIVIWWKIRDTQAVLVRAQLEFIPFYQRQNQEILKATQLRQELGPPPQASQASPEDPNAVENKNNSSYFEVALDPDAELEKLIHAKNEKRFPLCLERMKEIELQSQYLNIDAELEAKSSDYEAEYQSSAHELQQYRQRKYFCLFDSPSLESKSNWFCLDLTVLLMLWSFNGVYAVAFVSWYFVFIVAQFHVQLMIPSLQIGLAAIVFAIVAASTAYVVRDWFQLKQYSLLITCYSIRIFVMFFGIAYNLTLGKQYGVTLFWVWSPVIAIVWAVGLITTQIMIIEQQPKRDTAKITAIKIAFKYAFGGLLASLIGLFWNYGANHITFEYAFTALDLLTIVILCGLIVVKMCHYGSGFTVHSVT